MVFEEKREKTNYSEQPFRQEKIIINDKDKEYSERVQAYTKYEIGRKISKNTESFTKK